MAKENTKALYIFVTSDRPDVYINTIGYCVDNFDISRIVLLEILKDKGQRSATEAHLRSVRNNIREQLSLLQENRYEYYDRKVGKPVQKELCLEDYHLERYARIAKQNIETQVIFYESLEQEINSLLQANDDNCIFDVSGLSKGLLVDVYMLCFRWKWNFAP